MQTMTILGSENNRVQNTFETIFLNAGILSPLSVLTEEVPDDQYVHVCLGSSFCIMSRDAIKESSVDIFGSVEVNANLFYSGSFSQYCHLQRMDLPAKRILWKDITSIDD